MASDTKEAKSKTAAETKTAPKNDTAAKAENPAVKDVSKPADGGAPAAAPSNYSRGEGQKPVTAAYRENWNAIFAKKKTNKKRR
jgi:hypothetical protein